MTLKKIAVFLIIIIVLGGGFFAYQKNRQSKDLSEHNRQKFLQIIKFAQETGPGGVLEMAAIIKKYHTVNGQYPINLMELHPAFITEKDFITKINWKYETVNKTFILKKILNNEHVYAMGPDMRLKSGKVLSAMSSQKIASVDIPKKRSAHSQSGVKSLNKRYITKKSDKISLNSLKSSSISKSSKSKKIPQEFTVVKKELDNNEKFLLSINTANLYIWKTQDGIIGFSNIQYPDQKNLIIYKNKTWVEFKYNNGSKKQK